MKYVEIAAGMKGIVGFRSYLARERLYMWPGSAATRVRALAEISRISPKAISTTKYI
jgi:hypothetical protein